MGGVVFDQVVSAVVEFPGEVEVQQAGGVDRQDVETQRVGLDGLQAQFVGCRDLVVLIQSASPNAQDIYVVPHHQTFKNVVATQLLLPLLALHLLQRLYLSREDLPQPLILAAEGQALDQLLLLHSGDQLAVHQPAEALDVGWVLGNCLGVEFHCTILIFLGLVALGCDAGLESVHLAVDVGVFELEFEDGQALFVLLVGEEGSGCQELETNVPAEQFVCLEERVHLFVVSISEVALSKQVDCSDVMGREGDEFICKEDGVCIGVHVQVVDGEVVESPEDFIAEDLGGEGVQFGEVVFGVTAVVGLQEFCQEEEAVGFGGSEDGGLLGLPAHGI